MICLLCPYLLMLVRVLQAYPIPHSFHNQCPDADNKMTLKESVLSLDSLSKAMLEIGCKQKALSTLLVPFSCHHHQ
uniref:Putative secreted protein n=1 Tax=Ixodes ricinus TaxID=34613 RepID=A0A6B0U450_IXORI